MNVTASLPRLSLFALVAGASLASAGCGGFFNFMPSAGALASQVEFSDLLQLQFSRGARAYAPLQPPVRNSEEVKRPEYISYAKPVSGVLLRTKPKALNLCKVSMGLLLRICPAAPEILENL